LAAVATAEIKAGNSKLHGKKEGTETNFSVKMGRLNETWLPFHRPN
jgi:hypothetical protein